MAAQLENWLLLQKTEAPFQVPIQGRSQLLETPVLRDLMPSLDLNQHSESRGRRISVSLRPAWSTEEIPGWPGLHRETTSYTDMSTSENKYISCLKTGS